MMNREAYEVADLGDFESVMYNVQPDSTRLRPANTPGDVHG